MAQITIEKINNGNYAVLVDGVTHSEHSTEDGARRMANSLAEREEVIDRNRQLRSLLATMHPSFTPDVSYSHIPTPQIREENKSLEMLAKNAGVYIGQPTEESEG